MPRNAVLVIARFWVICFLFALVPFGLPALAAGVLSLPFLAFVALLVAVGFNFFQWLGHRAIFGGTEEYQQLRKSDLDPWFDSSCPWPFRSDTDFQTDDEPESHFFCNHCGTEAFDLGAPCRACGYEQYECPICGAPVRDELAACHHCGNDPLGRRGTC